MRNNDDFLADLGKPMLDAVFNIGGTNIRQVTCRQAPSVINSAYKCRFFWDGRARETFNGVNPFGDTPAAGNPQVLQVGTNSLLSLVSLSLNNGSAASQAVGPATKSVEMSYQGRTFRNWVKNCCTRQWYRWASRWWRPMTSATFSESA